MTLARILRPIFVIDKKQVQSCKYNNQISGLYMGYLLFLYTVEYSKNFLLFLDFYWRWENSFVATDQTWFLTYLWTCIAAKKSIECSQHKRSINKLQSKQRWTEKGSGKMVTLFTCFTFRLNAKKKYKHNSNRSCYRITRPTL